LSLRWRLVLAFLVIVVASSSITTALVGELTAGREIHPALLALAAAAGLLCVASGWTVAAGVARPLEALTATAETIGTGRGQAVPDVRGFREVRQLSHSLALAVATMRRQRGELKQMNATLERRVEERTRELIESQAVTETSRRQLAAIFDSVIEALLSVDGDGLIGNANRAAERLFGRRREELLGLKAWDLFTNVKRLPGDEGAESTARTVEAVAKNAGGFNVPVEVTLATEALGNQHLTTLSIRDVSLWREIERLRTELLSTVGYELRTPLTSLVGAVDLVDALGRDLPQEIRELLDIAQRNSRRLTQVVNDILDAERIQAGRLQLDLQLLDGHEAVNEAVASFAEAASARQVRLDLALPAQSLPLRADPQRLQQVLRILIDNALKFAPEGTAVTIAAERKAREVRISVLDQGPGVPAEFRDRIFQRFARAEPTGEVARPHGTGLGLAIGKAIVEQHGGAIGYESKPGNTMFWFALPLRRD
jgi:PAS domain S-box-containing protein